MENYVGKAAISLESHPRLLLAQKLSEIKESQNNAKTDVLSF